MKTAAVVLEALSCVVIVFASLPASASRPALPDELHVTVGGMRQRLTRSHASISRPREVVRVRGAVVNREPLCDTGPFPGEPLPSFPKVLAIVTTQELATRSQKLQEYVNWRLAQGFTVVVATEVDWDVPTVRDGDDRQARIRAWLKTAYAERGPGYVLLIGDPSPDRRGIPMRRMEPLDSIISAYPPDVAASLAHVPSDAYYADLESDWDCNGDGTFGAFPADSGDGCADWGPEVIVGRIPVYANVSEADFVLAATLDYERALDKAYRKNLIFAGAFGGFRGEPDAAGSGSSYDSDDDMAVYLERTAVDLPTDRDLSLAKLYEDEGVVTSLFAHDAALNRDNLVARWNLGASTVAWAGHGSDTASYRLIWQEDGNQNLLADGTEVIAMPFINRYDVAAITGPSGAFVHMMSCLNGFAEDAQNLGTALLGHGAIGTASASRSAVGVTGPDWEPRPELASATDDAYYFVLLVQRGVKVGEALAYTKWALPADGWADYEGGGPVDLNAYGWLTKAEYNLYGDPTLSIEACVADLDCDDHLPCDGVERCAAGFCIHDAPVVCGTDGLAACETRRCDNATGGCVVAPAIDGIRCDDGRWCTEGDACDSGLCVGAPRACDPVAGYLATCDEIARECTLEPVGGDDPPSGRGCAATSTPLSLALIGLFAAAGLVARRARRPGKAD